jgi:hypothetical protein
MVVASSILRARVHRFSNTFMAKRQEFHSQKNEHSCRSPIGSKACLWCARGSGERLHQSLLMFFEEADFQICPCNRL